MQSNSTGQIDKLVHVLGSEFALSANGNARKGGLIGLAALAIGMGKVIVNPPILEDHSQPLNVQYVVHISFVHI